MNIERRIREGKFDADDLVIATAVVYSVMRNLETYLEVHEDEMTPSQQRRYKREILAAFRIKERVRRLACDEMIAENKRSRESDGT